MNSHSQTANAPSSSVAGATGVTKRTISKVILHIGSHKTGSSYLQQYLYENREKLLRHGVYYPELPNNPYIQQHSVLALTLRGENRDSGIHAFEKLAEKAAAIDVETMLLSGEEFFVATDQEVAVVRRILESRLQCEFRVLAYIRNTHDYVRSQINQHLRFESYPFTERNIVSALADYQPTETIGRWESVFGPDAVEVFSYDEHKSTLLEHFVKTTGLPWLGDPAIISKEVTNPSIDFLSAFIINQLLYDRPPDTRHQVYTRIVAQTKNWEDLRYVAEIAMIDNVVNEMKIDLSHPKLQPILPHVSNRAVDVPSAGLAKETIQRLVLALDTVTWGLEYENELAATAAQQTKQAADGQAAGAEVPEPGSVNSGR